jgi:hypothetical protein
VTLVATAATLAQMLIDLVIAVRAADKPAMDAMYHKVFGVPAVNLICYQLGPSVLFVGLIVLMFVAAARRTIAMWQAVLTLVAMTVGLAGRQAPGALRVIEGIGLLGLLIALAPLRSARRDDRPALVSQP